MNKLTRLLVFAFRLMAGLLTGRLVRDYYGENHIALTVKKLPSGLTCLLAEGLVAQPSTAAGSMLAHRGYNIYELKPSEDRFNRIARVPCPIGKAWLGHFQATRDLLRKSDMMDLLPLQSGAILAFAAGRVYRLDESRRHFEEVFRLRFWGPGVGRGVLSMGAVQLSSSNILFGEYFANPDRKEVNIYASDDDGRTWEIRHRIPPGQIRHVHGLCQDPYTGALWLTTGDTDEESFIAVSHDDGKTFERIGGGDQGWRTCKLLFTDNYIYWAADTAVKWQYRNIYRWSKQTGELEKIKSLDGAVECAAKMANGVMVVASTRGGWESEWDDVSSLWVSKDGTEWKRMKLTPWLNQAKPRFAVPQISDDTDTSRIGMTCLNMADYDGQLLVIDQDDLLDWFNREQE